MLLYSITLRCLRVNSNSDFLLCRKVEVETNNNHTRRDIYNVIAVLKGFVEPGASELRCFIMQWVPNISIGKQMVMSEIRKQCHTCFLQNQIISLP